MSPISFGNPILLTIELSEVRRLSLRDSIALPALVVLVFTFIFTSDGPSYLQ